MRLIPNANGVVKRFPVPVLGCAVVAATLIAAVGQSLDDRLEAWIAGWSATTLAAVAITLFCEARGSRNGPLMQALALLPGVLVFATYPSPHISVLWLHVALVGWIAVAPAPGKDELKLWSFNARFAAMAAFAFVAGVVLLVGLLSILSAVRYLFDLPIDSRWYQRITIFCFVFATPIYCLALAPRHEAEPLQPTDLLAKAAAALGVLVAVVIGALAVLLYVYAAKIALAGALPKNEVGWIVSTTLSVGLAGWLLSAGEGGPADRLRTLFRRWWFALTIVPVALLAYAIYERIEAYGVTAERYAVAAAALVSLASIALAVARGFRPPRIRSVLLAASAVATIAAVGPLNMPNVVASSQISRLVVKLQDAGLLKDGRLAGPLPGKTWTSDAANDVRGMVGAIYDVGARDRLAGLMPVETLPKETDASRYLSAEYGPMKPNGSAVVTLPQRSGPVDVPAGTLVGPFSLVPPVESHGGAAADVTIDEWSVWLETRRLTVSEPGRETVFDLAALDAGFDHPNKRPMTIASTDGRSMLVIDSANLRRSAGKIEVIWLNGSVVIAKP